ncbi:Luc7-like protein 3 [Dinochytrium kinnereticum]|nr:Luc7-like protein 3 [Dinochytrium kinnereticum]
MDYQRKLFEELMNPLIGVAKSYKDKDVCKHQMVAFCPYELFTNTKVDLGACPSKVHDDRLREDYQASADKGHLGWEQAFANFLTKLVNDMDRSIKRGKERINTTGPVGPDDPAAIMAAAGEAEQEERIVFLEEQAKTLTAQMEEFGEMGEVEKAQSLLHQVEALKQNISSIKNTIGRRLTICEICSACLVANETAQRMDAHLIGKQHTGYLKIRQWLDAWKVSCSGFMPRLTASRNHLFTLNPGIMVVERWDVGETLIAEPGASIEIQITLDTQTTEVIGAVDMQEVGGTVEGLPTIEVKMMITEETSHGVLRLQSGEMIVTNVEEDHPREVKIMAHHMQLHLITKGGTPSGMSVQLMRMG